MHLSGTLYCLLRQEVPGSFLIVNGTRATELMTTGSPSVVHVQKLHWNLRPPSINTMNGHMYALHRLHRTGPI